MLQNHMYATRLTCIHVHHSLLKIPGDSIQSLVIIQEIK